LTPELSSQPPAAPRAERRGAPRHAAALRWLFHVLAPDGAVAAYAVLEDASASGLRLLVSAGCQPGPAVLLARPPHPLAGRLFPICIERAGAVQGLGLTVGGRFTPPITDAEARALAEAD
jgi:hypothetical protein